MPHRLPTSRSLLAPLLACVLVALGLGLARPAGAQTYDPSAGGSPLTILQAPPDGVDYYERLQRAMAANTGERWAEAELLFDQLTREYPRDPLTWALLGRARLRQGKGHEAAAAYLQAGPLIGWDLQHGNGYRAAAAYARAGDRRAALDMLRHMIFERHGTWRQDVATVMTPHFDSLKTDPEFLELTGHPDTTGWTRDEGWRRDIDYLYHETKRVNPEYRDEPFPAELTRRYEALKRDVPTLSDEEIFFGMRRMLAVLHQGHTNIWGFPGALHLPVQLYAFPDGIYVVAATDEHSGLLGSRVVRIGGVTAEEALRRLAEASSVDGDMEYLLDVGRLSNTAVLKGMGAIDSANTATLVVTGRDGRSRSVTLSAGPPLLGGRLPPPSGVSAPLFLQNQKEVHWDVALPEHGAHYLQLNNILPDSTETLDQLATRLYGVLQQTTPRSLILDLRHNGGGSTQSYPNLLRTLIAYSLAPGNQLYVLIGRNTYSAAGNLVTDLERLATPVFVGEATSECCFLYGDAADVVLPYSGIQAGVTAWTWNLGMTSDRRREMSPEVPVQLTAEDYFAGRDPALDAVFRLIARRAAAAP
jgi:tetratricopeptide (TPR) repeat protein